MKILVFGMLLDKKRIKESNYIKMKEYDENKVKWLIDKLRLVFSPT